MTATLIGLLMEEGRINWNDSLKSLLPHITLHASFEQVTVEMLSAHRAGLAKNIEGLQFGTKETVANNMLARIPHHTPGTTFGYSNAGYIILGHIIEVITGRSESWFNRSSF